MAGKKDIVEQALKLVMGGGDDVAKAGIGAYRANPASLYTRDVFHGTKDPAVATVKRTSENFYPSSTEVARKVGMHVAPDPAISSSSIFVGTGNEPGNILPLRMLPDENFYEINQPLMDYVPAGTPKTPTNIRHDDYEISRLVLNEAYKYHPEILVRYLKSARNMTEPGQAEEFAAKLLNDEPVKEGHNVYNNLEEYVRNYNPIPYDPKDAVQLIDTFRNVMRQRGYSGLKYFNTGRAETENAKNYSSYIVFPPAYKEDVAKWKLPEKQPFPLRGRFAKYDPENIHEPDLMKAFGGEVNDDDIDDALRIAKDVGGSASVPVMAEDAKGNKYDAQGNIILPTNPGPDPQRSDVDMTKTYQALSTAEPQGGMEKTYSALAASDMPKNAEPPRPLYSDEAAQKFDAGASRRELTDLEYWNSLPAEQKEALIAQYPELREEMRLAGDVDYYKSAQRAKASQPYGTQSMTHDAPVPRTEMKINMPLFGGEYSMGTAPYNVAEGLQGAAQTAYDFKTMPAYFFPPTAPFALGADVLESRLADDPTGFILNAALTPQGASAAKSALGAIRRNPKTTAAAIGAGAYLSPDEAEAGPARWFSKAMEVARAIPMEKMTGQQALAMLRKGVSPEELKWTGADVFLPQQKQITKQDLVDYLSKNRVTTEDVVFADRSSKYPYKSAEGWQGAISRAERAGNFDEAERLTLAWEEYEGLGGFETPRYKRHSTLGGEDYKETLITLPTNEYGRLFQSGHWEGYPNVIGHIRTQVLDVTPPGANRPYKAFNVDEAQSDYAKEGREIGFSSAEEISKREEEVRAVQKEREKYQSDLRAEGEKIAALEWEAERQLGPFPPISDRFARQQRIDEKRAMLNSNPDYMEAYSRHAELQQKNNELIREELRLSRNIKGVPSAPYVASTQNWTDLSVKKALDQAMDAGADYFTYTPGKAQAARYSLRNAVDELHYSPSENRLYGRKDGRWVFDQKVEPDKLSKYIGSAVADELLKQPAKTSKWYATPRHVLSGQQLELGGEGMIDYYDNIYKKRVEKVVKDATGKKVQWEVIPVQTADGPREQLGFRLTDDMKEARFSDFNKGGRVADPVVNKALALTRY